MDWIDFVLRDIIIEQKQGRELRIGRKEERERKRRGKEGKLGVEERKRGKRCTYDRMESITDFKEKEVKRKELKENQRKRERKGMEWKRKEM